MNSKYKVLLFIVCNSLLIDMLTFVTKIKCIIKIIKISAVIHFRSVLLGYVKMIRDLNDTEIILEIRELIAGIDSAKNEVNVYCDLMKQMFLSGSREN